jgi:hypothetical protein
MRIQLPRRADNDFHVAQETAQRAGRLASELENSIGRLKLGAKTLQKSVCVHTHQFQHSKQSSQKRIQEAGVCFENVQITNSKKKEEEKKNELSTVKSIPEWLPESLPTYDAAHIGGLRL